jgi:hypothetical protein
MAHGLRFFLGPPVTRDHYIDKIDVEGNNIMIERISLTDPVFSLLSLNHTIAIFTTTMPLSVLDAKTLQILRSTGDPLYLWGGISSLSKNEDGKHPHIMHVERNISIWDSETLELIDLVETPKMHMLCSTPIKNFYFGVGLNRELWSFDLTPARLVNRHIRCESRSIPGGRTDLLLNRGKYLFLCFTGSRDQILLYDIEESKIVEKKTIGFHARGFAVVNDWIYVVGEKCLMSYIGVISRFAFPIDSIQYNLNNDVKIREITGDLQFVFR